MKFRLINSDMRRATWLYGEYDNADMRHEDGTLCDGMCDPPQEKNKRIRIRRGIPLKRHLIVTIHEAAHAADQSKDDEWITHFAEDLGSLLWRLGYRRISEEDQYDQI